MRKLLAWAGICVGGLWTVINIVGNLQTAKDVWANQDLIVRALLTTSQFWPLALFLVGIFALACIQFGSPKLWPSKIRQPAMPEPQPIFVAIDQLRSLFWRGQALYNRFEVPHATKPTFGECVAWNDEATVCARQQVFADMIRPKDMARFRDKWDESACRAAEAKLDQFGCLENVNDVGRAVLRYIYGRVKRLEELLAQIDGKSDELSVGHHIFRATMAHVEKSSEEMRIRIEASQKQRQEVLEKAAAFLNKTPRSFIADFNALPMAGAQYLTNNRDLVWVCKKLAEGGHSHPLKEVGEYVPERDWLDFLKWVIIRANTDIKIGYGYIHAAEEWPRRKGYDHPEKPLPRSLLILAEENWPQ